MYYIKVWVADASFHGKEALTYKAKVALSPGRLVVVPLKTEWVFGIVEGVVPRPTFPVKEVAEVLALPALPAELVSLHTWIASYYPAPLGIITQLFAPRKLPKQAAESEHASQTLTINLPPLTKDQANALHRITGSGLHLLHGTTGTGKTRVYIELAKQQLQKRKSSVILTPEIGLTSQLANDFRKIFGADRVKIIHSQLANSTRQKLWSEILQTQTPLIVIGARSALFSPLRNIGLFVIDECHETAYKQDQAPYYHANVVGAKLAALHGATLILGSATPPIADYYVAQAKGRPIIQMTQLASSNRDVEHAITIVDHRDKQAFSKSPHLSNDLIAAIETALHNGEQSLLFLNRRGTARIIFCEQCGWQALCPHCDIPLVYHGDTHTVRCHSCSFTTKAPVACPDCGNPSIIFKSVGTKAIMDEIVRLFPSAKAQRFDTDNKKNERIEEHYDAIRAGKVNIVVGTQTIAKGLDLPKLGLVGVINAETGLSFPDFSATERTFQLLVQVLGRVGRGHRNTQAVIQTYSPDSPLIKAAVQKKWDEFYNNEITERKKFNFPPFCHLLKLTCRRAQSASAEQAARTMSTELAAKYKNIVIEGPAAAFHEKSQNKYQWQLVIKAKKRQDLVDIISHLPNTWSYDIDPLNLL